MFLFYLFLIILSFAPSIWVLYSELCIHYKESVMCMFLFFFWWYVEYNTRDTHIGNNSVTKNKKEVNRARTVKLEAFNLFPISDGVWVRVFGKEEPSIKKKVFSTSRIQGPTHIYYGTVLNLWQCFVHINTTNIIRGCESIFSCFLRAHLFYSSNKNFDVVVIIV